MMERKKLTITILGFGNVGKVLTHSLVSDTQYALTINIVDSATETIGAYVDIGQGNQVNGLHDLFYNDEYLLEASDYIFHCAGKGVSKDGNRLELTEVNSVITKSLFEHRQLKSSAKIIVVTNPVDVITLCSWKFSGLERQNVIGVGTYLDSVRMNYYVQEELSDYSLNVSSVILGEHGTSAVFAESLSTINNQPFKEFMNDSQMRRCVQKTISAAKRIKETQTATIFGVAACAVSIFHKIESDSKAVLPLTTVLSAINQDRFSSGEIAMSIPCTLGQHGALQHEKIELSGKEFSQLSTSASIISRTVELGQYCMAEYQS